MEHDFFGEYGDGGIAAAFGLAPLIVNYGWRYGAIGMGLILLVVAFPLAYFKVHDPRAEVGIQAAAQGQHGNWRVAIGMLRLPALRNLFVSRFACGLSFLLIPHLATAAMASGLSAAQGALAVTLYGADRKSVV